MEKPDRIPGKKLAPDAEMLRPDVLSAKKGGPRKKQSFRKKLLLAFAVIIFIFFGGLLGFYGLVVSRLPNVSDLRSKASQFETMRILDRQGNLLFEVVSPDAGRRDYVTLDQISSYLIASVIAVEDQDYYNHPGFDIRAIIRAFFQNAESGTTVSGASTITQQLARNILLPEGERSERTVSRKIREIILAAEITRRYSKDEILEIYLNENYFGNHAYGIEAAARTYFHKSAKDLDLAESAFLAGLPQAPGYYDIFNNREATLARQRTVLLLAYTLSTENRCISIRSGAEYVQIDPLMINNAVREMENYSFTAENFSIEFPHWVNYVYSLLEDEYGADTLYRSGYTVTTTLDPDLQNMLQRVIKDQVGQLESVSAYNGAGIILDPKTGDILAMVGSPDFGDNEHSGQVNMAVSPRQPGSAIKPLIYAAAFEKGWTPATLIWDVKTDFSPTGKAEDMLYSPPYQPVNYDGSFHGPVLVRDALGSSLNIPAVKALQYVGIYDDPETENEDGFIPFARRFHVNSLDRAGYGLSIALGGGEVTLLELTNAFAVFANNGKYVHARSILRIEDHQGALVYEAQKPLYEDVLKEEYAWQINSILSDDSARSIGFGTGSILNLSFPAAVKTGTTNDYRDNWTIGYNSSVAIGIWVGNADNRPMTGSTGVTGAAPIWNSAMEQTAAMYPEIRNAQFIRPGGIVDVMICRTTGSLPDGDCGSYRWEQFASFQQPAANEGLIVQYYADSWSGKLVSAECAAQAELKRFLNVKEPEAQAWIRQTAEGRSWAASIHAEDLDFIPSGEVLTPPCGYPALELIYPQNGAVIHNDQIDIAAVVYSQDGNYAYSIDFAPLSEPEAWRTIRNDLREPHYSPEKVADWYLWDLENGEYRIRIRMTRDDGRYYEKINTVRVQRDRDDLYYRDDFAYQETGEVRDPFAFEENGSSEPVYDPLFFFELDDSFDEDDADPYLFP